MVFNYMEIKEEIINGFKKELYLSRIRHKRLSAEQFTIKGSLNENIVKQIANEKKMQEEYEKIIKIAEDEDIYS